jgi:hypothetical protein
MHNKESAISHVKSLAFSRNAGTAGEYISKDYIISRLKEENMDTEEEPFLWVSIWSVYKLFFISVILLLLIEVFISFFRQLTKAYGLMLILVNFMVLKSYLESIVLYKTFDQKEPFQKKNLSHNITTTIKAKSDIRKKPVVIFSAHYDSISFNYSQGVLTSILLIFIIYASVLFPISVVLDFSFVFKLFRFILLLGLLTFFLTFKNTTKSKGSIDNASGMAILIELSKKFHKNPLNNLGLIFLWTGAEEVGTFGSKTYCYRNFKRLDKAYNLDKSYIINIDMVGSYIGLIDKVGIFQKTPLNISLNNKIEEIAIDREIVIKKETKSVSISSDHSIFKTYAKKLRRDLQIGWFHSKMDDKFIHSSKDTPEKCTFKNLNDCIELCYFTIKKLDTDLVRT